MGHYLSVTDAHFDAALISTEPNSDHPSKKAAQKAAQSVSEMTGNDRKTESQVDQNP
jgi:hypothetical protein